MEEYVDKPKEILKNVKMGDSYGAKEPKKPGGENSYDPNKHNGSFKFKVNPCKHAKLKVGK